MNKAFPTAYLLPMPTGHKLEKSTLDAHSRVLLARLYTEERAVCRYVLPHADRIYLMWPGFWPLMLFRSDNQQPSWALFTDLLDHCFLMNFCFNFLRLWKLDTCPKTRLKAAKSVKKLGRSYPEVILHTDKWLL